jgi:NADPH2:quinone reductase
MNMAIRVHETGGPDKLCWEEVDIAQPGVGDALIRHTAIGLNFIDIYFREGAYPPPHLPFILGMEAAGVIEAVGRGVTEVSVGDRVVYAGGPIGAYCEQRIYPAERLVKLPDEIDDVTAAALMLKGLTAQYLLRRTYSVKPGDVILFHAAAGGVGSIACQWAKHLGATVIGTAGSKEKADYAAGLGCDYPINYTQEDFVERVKQITAGTGVPVVYDSVGKDTFMKSLDCLRKLGLMVIFGQSSGAVAPIDPSILAKKGSLYLTRPTLFDYIDKRSDLVASASELFDVVASGAVTIDVKQTYALEDAAQAQQDLMARGTVGASVLIPGMA